MSEEKKLTKEEIIKEKTNFLRGSIKEDLKKTTPNFEADNSKLLKFHGIYEQDDRDLRSKLTSEGKEKAYSFMIRTKLPGGKLSASQYLSLDEIAEKYTNKTLRITTRQTIQFHGIVKGNLHKTMNEINKLLITTYGACGDVVRNVMSPPISDIDPDYPIDLIPIAENISNHFLPNSKSYFEIWVKDENDEEIEITTHDKEPLYGKTYLPRKFKIGLAYAEDNSVDLFTQDVGIIPILNADETLSGFNIYIGGGLGHNHNKPETYPRIASAFCFIENENLINVIEKIVLVQRDFGGRENRKHARLKYLIDDKGLDWFRSEVESRIGFKLKSPKEIIEFQNKDYLGWHKQKNGKWYLGIFIESGRIKDSEKKKERTGLREIIKKFTPEIRFTPQQNIILCNIDEKNKNEIEKLIEEYGFYIAEKTLSSIRRNSIACVSMPTCGLAIAEAERHLPSVLSELEKNGYGNEEITIRISGCPNSCSRAPASEIGIIGTSANKYNLYIGGDFNGTRLNKLFKEHVSGELLATEIGKLIDRYKLKKENNERFGDFCSRVKFEDLK